MGVIAFLCTHFGRHVHLTSLHVVGVEAWKVWCGEAPIHEAQVECRTLKTDILKLDVPVRGPTLLKHVPNRTEQL